MPVFYQHGLLQRGLRDMETVPGPFYADLQTGFPLAWDAMMEHLASYPARSCSNC